MRLEARHLNHALPGTQPARATLVREDGVDELRLVVVVVRRSGPASNLARSKRLLVLLVDEHSLLLALSLCLHLLELIEIGVAV